MKSINLRWEIGATFFVILFFGYVLIMVTVGCQSLYEEECKSGKATVFPLKLVIMSATLRVDEFVVNKGLFPCPPPVVHVPARQFPVTVHFSAKTELVDYVGKAFKKVCAIHKKLPPGGVLVFLTGQAEVHHLCMRLQDAFPNKDGKKKTNEVSEDDQENFIDELADVQHYELDEIERDENWDVEELSNDSDSESDLEFAEEEKIIHEKHDSDWNAKDGLCLAAIKDAFDVLTGTMNISESSTSSTLKKDKTPVGAGPLHVLPLFALLPASAQLKVFGTVPAGSRLVVVATNVAETSITIPGIRYVVDCGRAKEKLYERGSGIAKYEIGWISKASAAQRAGRAGRTGPGHCYRLYSSAIFNDTFPEFTQPEICRAPIEGLILLLKSMGIVKVLVLCCK
jgi:ATP-dependent RNA helicase DHX37/DHR1